jgi:hypothetical protein
LRGITASRRAHTARYSDGPGRRESVMHAAKPTRSTKMLRLDRRLHLPSDIAPPALVAMLFDVGRK